MLPSTLQFVIAMIACAINERMQRKLDYTQEEVRVLKEVVRAVTGTGRISFTADQRVVSGKPSREFSHRNRKLKLVKRQARPFYQLGPPNWGIHRSLMNLKPMVDQNGLPNWARSKEKTSLLAS